MSKYGKAVAAIVAALLTALYVALGGDGRIDQEEWVQVAIAVASAVGVWLIPIAPQIRWGKTAVAVVLAVLQLLTTVIIGGIRPDEWIILILAGLQAAGVAVAPAVSDNGISSRTAPPPPSKHSGTEGTAPGNW